MKIRGRKNPWLQIPEELQEKVFALLPVESILHSRGVCRQWRTTLTSPAFLRHWSSVAVSVPWFLMFRDARLRAYNPSLGIWQNIPVTSNDSSNLSLVASSGGLIFLSSHHQKSSNPLLIVCNPLALSCRVLPNPTTVTLIYIMGMFQCSTTGGYKIMVAGATSSHKKHLVTEVFDSVTCTWTCENASPGLEAFQDFTGMRAVYCNGFFYCLSVAPYRLAAYDTRTCRWIGLNIEPPVSDLGPGSDLGSASLFVFQDRLMLAAKLMQGKSLKRIQIWELEQVEQQKPRWNGLRLSGSSSVLGKFCRCLTYFMALQRPKGLDSICFNSWCRWRTLMYDVAEKTWHWLPEHSGKFKDMLSGITYEPTFSADGWNEGKLHHHLCKIT